MPRTVTWFVCTLVAACGVAASGDDNVGVARVKQGPDAGTSSFGEWQNSNADEGVVRVRKTTTPADSAGVVRITRIKAGQPGFPAGETKAAHGVRSQEEAVAANTFTGTPVPATPPGNPKSRGQALKSAQSAHPEKLLAQETPPLPPQADPVPPAPSGNPGLSPVPMSAEPDVASQNMAGRMRILNRPVNTIGLVEVPAEGQQDPENVARAAQGNLPPVSVWGAPWPCVAPQRYTYCFVHNTLYYQDVNLERCGRAHCCQTLVSAADFVGRTAILPYLMMVSCPCDCETALGDCPTCHMYPSCTCGLPHGSTESEIKGIAVEAAAIVGIAFLVM